MFAGIVALFGLWLAATLTLLRHERGLGAHLRPSFHPLDNDDLELARRLHGSGMNHG
ncbi:hypothetical protein NVS55_13775 [Myxococcus stipitatus]|uniref:hypothetical protein n=1 Tax=Myxococcus stipitatus TaxID=83455 RepID=UPI00314537B8